MIDGKKAILMLGAIAAMKEIVQRAQQKGYYVVVTDYLEDSPCKKIADESWMFSIDDVDSIVMKCKERNIDGVMNFCIDPAQKPYVEICNRLDLPCVATKDQFDIMTNKDRFAEVCSEYGISTIPEYVLDEKFLDDDLNKLEYPVLIKPADGRASKGIRVCYNKEQVKEAFNYALQFSKRKKVLVQKYIQDCPEICAKYVAANGEIYLSSMADVFTCYKEDGTRVYLGTQTYPSRYFDEYLKTTNEKVIQMLKGIGIKNGATSFTGFYDNGIFRMFDPSLRMGGAQDWRVVDACCGIDMSDLLTNFALTGEMGDINEISKIDKAIASRYSALLYTDILTGTIGTFEGITEALKVKGVVGYHQCHEIGDTINGLGTADNVAVRFIVSCKDKSELISSIKEIQKHIVIKDINGNDMRAPLFNPALLN